VSVVESLLQSAAWLETLEKYGESTRLTTAVYNASVDRLLGPIHPTSLFEAASGLAHSLFEECARRCLGTADRVVVVEACGLAVVGSRLIADRDLLGVVVAGYAVTTFPIETAVRRFAADHGLPVAPLWRAMRQEPPLTKERLRIYAELLNVVSDRLVNEHVRTRELEQTAQRLREANRAKDEFLAMLSHELRNPLGPIQAAMQIIGGQGADRPTMDKARQIADRQVKHLVRLLDDLLDVSRITRGRIELRKEPVNIAHTVTNALDTTRELISAQEHALSVALPEEPVVVEGDPVRLEQIVVNLVTNAAKYTPPRGRLAISAGREGGDAVIRVRDSGIGIPRDLLPRVFDLFQQGERPLARSPGGLGIGLTIVRSLVALHGGTVDAHSEGEGTGSEFIVRLPLAAVTEMIPPSKEDGRPSDEGVPPLRILVIEDDPDNRETVRTLLELEGYRPEVAKDGPEGVECARMWHPDVALIDIGLPKMDGYEVVREIRRHFGTAIRLIALTGYGRPDDRRRADEAGFDAYVVKPLFSDQLARALRAVTGY
jgi:signal transduction histidine kinase